MITSVVVDVSAGMAAQVMEEYDGYAEDIPANTRIKKIDVSHRGKLHSPPMCNDDSD